MKMSSPERRRFEGRPIAQHGPQDVDPPSSQRDESLGVPLALPSLAVVEGPGVSRGAQAGERREEEDPLERLVAAAHSSVVANPLAGVAGRRDEPCVGSELVGALEDREVSDGRQELGPEDRTDAGQASEDPGLGAVEKTARYLLVQSEEALFEGEDLLGGQLDALGFRRSEGPLRQLVGPLDAAPFEVGGEALMPRPADLGRALVAGEEDEGALLVEVQGALEGRKEGQKRLSEAGNGAGPVDDEVASAGEEELQLGEGAFLGGKLGEVPSHAGLVGYDAGVPLIRFGLPTVSVAGTVDGEAGNIDHPLTALPQERQEQGGASTGLVDGPHDIFRKGERLVDERREAPLVVFDPAGEHLRARGVKRAGPVERLSRIDANPSFVHENLHPSLAGNPSPSENPADGSLCSECWTSPISISGRGLLERGRGAIPFKPSEGGDTKAILGPFGRHSETVPERQTQR